MIIIKEIFNLGTQCPTQFAGKTIDDKELYIRYRFGYLRADVNEEVVFEKAVGGQYDGCMTYEEVKSHLNEKFLLPDEAKPIMFEEYYGYKH